MLFGILPRARCTPQQREPRQPWRKRERKTRRKEGEKERKREREKESEMSARGKERDITISEAMHQECTYRKEDCAL